MIPIPEKTKGLIFDLDGTIANTMQNHFIAWREAVMPYGIDFNAELFKTLTGIPREATIEKLNSKFNTDMNPVEVGKIKSNKFNTLVNSTNEISIVADVIRKFHKILPMSIGTGSTKKGAQKTLEIIGLKKYFEIIITANDISNPKPHPETFLTCAKLMEVNPSECLVFEDGILGIEAAKTAGMMVVDINEYFEMKYII